METIESLKANHPHLYTLMVGVIYPRPVDINIEGEQL
jgi:hypothetical protein